MRVKDVGLRAFDDFYQRKQGRQAEGPFHGQGKVAQIAMAKLATLFAKWAVRLTNQGNTVPTFQ